MSISKQALAFKGCDNIDLVGEGRGNPKNPTVLFAHGGGQTRHAWGGAANALAEQGFYAVTLDLRGHGDSSWCPDGNYDLEFYAHDIIEVTKALPAPVHAVGASLGGLAALVAEGALKPGTLASLTLVDITPRMEEEGIDQVLGFMAAHAREGFASLDEAADVIAKYLPHRKRPKDNSGLAKNLRHKPDGRYYWHWDPAFVENSTSRHKINKSGSEDLNEHRLEEAAASLTIPAHLIRGRLSQLVSEQAAEHFKKTVPHARYTDISGAGHMIAGDKNDIFTEAVASFLTSL